MRRLLAVCTISLLIALLVTFANCSPARSQYPIAIHLGDLADHAFLVDQRYSRVYILRYDGTTETYYWELMEFRKTESDLRNFEPLRRVEKEIDFSKAPIYQFPLPEEGKQR